MVFGFCLGGRPSEVDNLGGDELLGWILGGLWFDVTVAPGQL